MSLPEVVSPDQWREARLRLLAAEKELTVRRDAVNAQRRRLPMVRIGKDYVFEGPHGTAPLAALFGDSSQLIIQHVMFDPAWDAACSGCTASADELSDGLMAHLRSRDTAFALVSRTPLAMIEAYRAKKGWTVPWYSSFGGDFNYDFHVSLDASVAPVEYNYKDAAELERAGAGSLLSEPAEEHGVSCFLRQGDAIYHTYSTYARGTELSGAGAYNWLDMTALGRQEDWEEPRGRAVVVRGADPTFTD
jgi:predicted dithiol-disulfide oxidoreductase (DUF899 family)